MKKDVIFEKLKELFTVFDELVDYGLYDYVDKAELTYRTFKNITKILGDKK